MTAAALFRHPASPGRPRPKPQARAFTRWPGLGITRESEQSTLFRPRNSIDLLFYHLGLRRFVVFELKSVPAQPEHVGKLNFYVNAVDDLLRKPEHGDASTIGILLAADRDEVAVQYALRGLSTPLAISTYTTHRSLPDEIRPALPSVEELTEVVREIQQDQEDNR